MQGYLRLTVTALAPGDHPTLHDRADEKEAEAQAELAAAASRAGAGAQADASAADAAGPARPRVVAAAAHAAAGALARQRAPDPKAIVMRLPNLPEKQLRFLVVAIHKARARPRPSYAFRTPRDPNNLPSSSRRDPRGRRPARDGPARRRAPRLL